jgi:hypothetical protein
MIRRLCPGAFGAARSDRLDAAAHLRACAPPSETRRLHRGRGRTGDARGRFLREPAARHRLLLGREDEIRETPKEAGIDLDRPGIELANARLSRREAYADYLYERFSAKAFCSAIASG